jgi:hypothetical protein
MPSSSAVPATSIPEALNAALAAGTISSGAMDAGRAAASSIETLLEWLGGLAEAENVSPAEVLDALRPAVAATLHTRRRAVGSLDEMVRTLMPSIVDLDPVPRVALEQARRRAALHAGLLAQGAYTYRALAEGRQASEATTRQFVRRARDKGQLFTAVHDGETLVPAFLLDDSLEPRPAFAAAIASLSSVGEDGWALWAWFATPSAWLGGRVPAEVAAHDPERVAAAAARRASNAA